MITLLTIIFLVLTIILAILDEDVVLISVTLLIFSIVALGITSMIIVNGRTIQPKLEMYQEENARIENTIGEISQRYMEYEVDTYSNLKGESISDIITLYPELKANQIIEKKLAIYVENNNKIKELKVQQINISNYKWWLYFGK